MTDNPGKAMSIKALLTQLKLALDEHRIAVTKYEALANQAKSARKAAEFYWMVQSHRAAVQGCLEDIEKLLILARSIQRSSPVKNMSGAESASAAANDENGRDITAPVEAACNSLSAARSEPDRADRCLT